MALKILGKVNRTKFSKSNLTGEESLKLPPELLRLFSFMVRRLGEKKTEDSEQVNQSRMGFFTLANSPVNSLIMYIVYMCLVVLICYK